MRLFFSALFIIFFFSASQAQTKLWDWGGGDSLWSNPQNWLPDGVPGPSDDVLLDNSNLVRTYALILPDIPVTVRSLTITPDPGVYLITLTLPPTNTITSDAFKTTDAVTIDAGGTFVNNGTVSSGTNLTIEGSFQIHNGGNYHHRTQSGIAWINKLSNIPGTEDGIFLFAVPSASYAVSLGGLSFGTLVFSTSAGPVNYSVSGSGDLNIRGDFNVNTFATVNIDMAGDIVVSKTFQMSFNSFLNLQSSSDHILKVGGVFLLDGNLIKTGTGIAQIQLNGVTNQDIYVYLNFISSIEFNINNAAGVTLRTNVTLPHTLILTKGKIKTSLTTLLTLAATATCPGGGSSISDGDATTSFVEGPMKKIGNADFTFPVGGGGTIYAPIGISGGGNISDAFTAEYKRGNAISAGPYGTAIDNTLDHISFVEYWTLQQNAGSATKKISLDVHATSFCRNLATTYVSRWNGTIWTNEGSSNGGSTTVGSYQIGTITSVNDISSFTAATNAFTLSTDDLFSSNPLPIKLISFDAIKINERKASLNWELAECCSPSSVFEIQRAGKGKDFLTIGKLNGSDTNRFYNYFDNGLKNGINYYRLKMIDADGKIAYSSIAAVMNGMDGLLLTSLIPSVVSHTASLTITSSKEQQFDLIIVDMQGRVVKKRNYAIGAGNRIFELSLDNLAAGIYQVAGINADSKTNTIRFIKQ